MRFNGTLAIAAPRDRVWAFITDAARIAPCLPDVKKVEILDETHYRVKCGLDVGIVGGAFTATVEIRDQQAPEHLSLSIDGMATSVMFDIPATMLTMIDLAEAAASDGTPARATVLAWTAELKVGAAYAPIEGFVGDAAKEKLIGPMIATVRSKVEAEEASAQAGTGG